MHLRALPAPPLAESAPSPDGGAVAHGHEVEADSGPARTRLVADPDESHGVLRGSNATSGSGEVLGWRGGWLR